ncbi:MAG: ABC transporter permease subunit [Spirochaetes bacterium]|nr:ABC transporter permease subunit [Spirochaetota bacterium]
MAIMKKELMAYFFTPIAYIVIIIFLGVTGSFFFQILNGGFFYYNQAEMRSFFQFLPLILTIVVPAITMRLFAEEIHSGTIEVMMTLPVKTADVVVGKFLAATLFTCIMIAPSLIYLVTIIIVGSPDPGPIIGGYLGSILLAGAYSAVGVLASSLSRNQIIAFIGGLASCFSLWLVDKITIFLPARLSFIEFFGTDFHFRNISRGIIDSRDLVYFFSIIVISILVTTKILDDRR